jgi:ABC-type multidrug transport system ATPase subunit
MLYLYARTREINERELKTKMVIVKNLIKKYGSLTANDGINLTVNAGEIAILLGPNGAGKSTLIKSICGLLRFEGEVTIDGHDCRSVEAKKILGYIPEFPTPFPMLTVGEHLEFVARAYKLENWRERADALLTRFELDDKRNKLGKELSKGMQQKISVCCAILPDPKVVIFDEPLVGLDPHGIRELKSVITELREQGKAVIVSTHIIDSVEESWDMTLIMNKGRFAREIRRTENLGEDLEEIYFSIIDESKAQSSKQPENQTSDQTKAPPEGDTK